MRQNVLTSRGAHGCPQTTADAHPGVNGAMPPNATSHRIPYATASRLDGLSGEVTAAPGQCRDRGPRMISSAATLAVASAPQ